MGLKHVAIVKLWGPVLHHHRGPRLLIGHLLAVITEKEGSVLQCSTEPQRPYQVLNGWFSLNLTVQITGESV